MKKLRIPLRILFYPEGDAVVAHGLELDLVGTGPTKQQALDMLREAVEIQVEATIRNGNLANLIRPADPEILEMYAAGRDVARTEMTFEVPRREDVEVEPADYREFSASGNLAVA